MSNLNFPQNPNEISEKIQTDIRNELPTSNPYLRNNGFLALAVGLAGRIYDVYTKLQTLINIFFDDTTFGIWLEKKATPYGITRNPATKASGKITITGTVGSLIPTGTLFKTLDGIQYEAKGDVTIATNTVAVSSLTSSSGIATAVFTGDTSFATGMEIDFAGANEAEYNTTATIQVISPNTITYPISGSPASPATGTITATADMGSIEVISVDYGLDKNQDNGVELTLVSGIAGIDGSAFVQYDGLSGGADLETDEDLRARYIFRKQNPVAHFNGIAIENEARKISFVDRVWVQDITPEVGQVTIYFSNKDGSSATALEIATVKNQILTIKPANTDNDDVFVYTPTLLPIAFTFSSLTPNTASMKQAIVDNLTNFFVTQTELATDVKQNSYIAAIKNTRDKTSGLQVADFVLSTPTGDITVASDELPTLGAVTFS